MAAPIGVGVIGVSSDRGWAAEAHLPALKILPQYEVRAVSHRNGDVARRAAQKFGVPTAYADSRELVTDPRVDLVVVTVKVPFHRDLVMSALDAGKEVYCEWPLGVDLAEAAALAKLADTTGLRAVIGLQARALPIVRYVRALVADGFLGEVLSTTMVGSGGAWGGETLLANAYTLDRANGAMMLSIPFGHAVDALCSCLGEFTELSAVTAVRRPLAKVVETGELLTVTSADQVAVAGVLAGGAVASIHYRGGRSAATNFLWEINGTAGDLIVTADGGHLQMAEPRLRGARRRAKLTTMKVPERYVAAPGAPHGRPFGVAQAYARLAIDIEAGSRETPTFDDAVTRHRMLEAIEAAAISGSHWRVA